MKYRNSRRGELRSPAGVHRTPLRIGNKILAAALAFVMVFGVLMFVSPTEAQAISLNATDMGFYNVAYDNNGVTIFGAGAQIRVINHTRAGKNKSDAVYQFDGAMDWEPVGETYVVWNGTENNTFYGVYPYNAEYDSFTIPTDQSGGVQDADWMTDVYTANKSAGNVKFDFQHRLSKVTVNITEWNDEFGGTAQSISTPKIYSKGTDVTATYGDSGVTIATTGNDTEIDPLVEGASYTAIVAPAKYAATDKFMTFTVNEQEMTVLGNSTLTNEGLQAGKHYIFYLAVGKDAVILSSVSVFDWGNGGTIDGGVAKECQHNFVDGICTECGAEASYTYDESSNVYRLYKAEYLKETIEEASNTGTSMSPATIILMDDITVPQGTSEDWMFEDNVEFNKGIVELDLNGKTLTTATNLRVTAKLVIHDSSYGSGQIISSSNDCLVAVRESGALTINGGTLNSTANSLGAVVGYGGHITINGGKIVAESNAVYPQSSPLIITGGQFEGAECALYLKSSSQDILIIGGSFTGDKYDIQTSGKTGFLSFNYGTGEGPRFPGGISIYNGNNTAYTLNPLLATEAEYVGANGDPITISDEADSYEGYGDVVIKGKP